MRKASSLAGRVLWCLLATVGTVRAADLNLSGANIDMSNPRTIGVLEMIEDALDYTDRCPALVIDEKRALSVAEGAVLAPPAQTVTIGQMAPSVIPTPGYGGPSSPPGPDKTPAMTDLPPGALGECEVALRLYGPAGERIAGLLSAKEDAAPETATDR